MSQNAYFPHEYFNALRAFHDISIQYNNSHQSPMKELRIYRAMKDKLDDFGITAKRDKLEAIISDICKVINFTQPAFLFIDFPLGV